MNATPRPWKVTQPQGTNDSGSIMADNLVIAPEIWGRSAEECNGNASLIVRAVNSYDAMRNYIETIARMKTEEEFGEDCPPSEDWICTLNNLIEDAREVLK